MSSAQPETRGWAGRILPVLGWLDRLSALCAIGAAAALVILALNVVADVLGRAFMNTPLPGTLEMTQQWWMPMLTILAFAYTERHQEHIKVTILLDTLPARMRQIVEGSFGLLATLLLALLTRFAFVEAMDSGAIGQTTSSSPPIAIWPFKYVAAAGVAMLTLQMGATTLRHFAGAAVGPDLPPDDAETL